jgi:hypothetical protein
VSNRTNAGDKTYWTRVFHHADYLNFTLAPDEVKPGVWCINYDLIQNELIFRDADHDDDLLADPIFEPKAFNELHQPLEMAFYNLPEDALLEYAELATTLRDLFAKRALELDTEYKDKNPNGQVTEKRLDTLV